MCNISQDGTISLLSHSSCAIIADSNLRLLYRERSMRARWSDHFLDVYSPAGLEAAAIAHARLANLGELI